MSAYQTTWPRRLCPGLSSSVRRTAVTISKPFSSQPALPAEQAEQAEADREHDREQRPEGVDVALSRHADVHAEEARDQRQRQQDDADDGEELQPVVRLVPDHGLVRVLERLDDLLVVVEHVPDALGRVDEVVEVEIELLGQEAGRVPLEHAQRGALGLDDLAVRDDLLLHVRDVPNRVLGALLEEVVLDHVELVPDLVEHREAVVEEVVEDVVQEVAGTLREELVAQRLVRLAAAEEPRDRQQLDVRQRDEVVVAEEEVELAGVEALDRRVVDGEVEDDEEVLRVFVELRPRPFREHVLLVELVPAEAVGELLQRVRVDSLEVDPGQAVSGDLLDARLNAGAEISGPGTDVALSADARDARHGSWRWSEAVFVMLPRRPGSYSRRR